MHCIAYESVDSTNLVARHLWSEYVSSASATRSPQPLAIVAAVQTAGLGRHGRQWQSPPGGLWLSIAWPAPGEFAAFQAFPLAVGLAAAETLEELYALPCAIKWPNDLLVAGKKLVGILCQGEPTLTPPAIIIGIGINANFPAHQLGHELRRPATTLRDLLGRNVDLAALRDHLLNRLTQTIKEYESGQWQNILLPRIQARLAWRNHRVRHTDTADDMSTEGILQGLDAAGQIVLQTAEGAQSFATGELEEVL